MTHRHTISSFILLLSSTVASGQPPVLPTEFRFAGQEAELVPPRGTMPFARQVMGDIRESWDERREQPTWRKPTWRVLAGWKAYQRPGAAQNPLLTAEVLGADDLQAVAVEFRSRPPHPDRTTLALVLDAREAGVNEALARQALRFFWQPRFGFEPQPRKKEEDPVTFKLVESKNPPREKGIRFALSSEELAGADQKSKVGDVVSSSYQTGNWPNIVPNTPEFEFRDGKLLHDGLRGLLELMNEIGRTGTGAVYWIAEEGKQPDEFLLAWLPETDAWRSPVVVSPKFGRQHLEICQVVPIPTADGRRTGLCRLPKGAWKLIEDNIAAGLRFTAIGLEGLVFETASPDPVYYVYRYRAAGFDKDAIQTRGIAGKLPPWTDKFNLRFDKTPAVDRHLVSLAVCSPALWKAPRTDERDPPEHLKPLFADPELWACPPIKR